MMRLAGFTGIILSLGIVLFTGCSRSPRVTFYVLGGAAAGTAAEKPSQTAPSISIANIALPDLVDRPQLVEKFDGSRVQIHEAHRWAEPLKSGIARLIAENLASRLGSEMVTVYPQKGPGEPDYKVFVNILNFETRGDTVTVDAAWNIRQTMNAATESGRSQAHETRDSGGYEALVAAYNRAVIRVSNDIAASIRADWTSRPQR